MKYPMPLTKALTVFMTCLILQSCFVQKNSESHATIIYDPYPSERLADTENVSVVTVEENNDQKSLETLSASLLLIDFHNEPKMNRWEDHLSYKVDDQKSYNRVDQEVLQPITQKN